MITWMLRLMTEKIKILDHKQLKQKINRLSWQVYENNIKEKNIVTKNKINKANDVRSPDK